MNIQEIDQQISVFEGQLSSKILELRQFSNLAVQAFSGNDNWRDRISIEKRVERVSFEIEVLRIRINELSAEKIETILIEQEVRKIADMKYAEENPIALINIEEINSLIETNEECRNSITKIDIEEE